MACMAEGKRKMIILFLILNLIPTWIATGVEIHLDKTGFWKGFEWFLLITNYFTWPIFAIVAFMWLTIKQLCKPAMFMAGFLDAIRKETNGKNKK